jgi:hypothetical protein
MVTISLIIFDSEKGRFEDPNKRWKIAFCHRNSREVTQRFRSTGDENG